MKFQLFHKPMFYVLLLLIILPVIMPMNHYEGFQSSDCELSPSEFKDSTKNGKVFTLFYANWCGHCKKMKPDWEAAAKQVNVNGQKKMVMVDLGDKDDLAQEQLRKDYNIRGYPTILDLEGGKQVGDYSGDRSVSALVSHVNSM